MYKYAPQLFPMLETNNQVNTMFILIMIKWLEN